MNDNGKTWFGSLSYDRKLLLLSSCTIFETLFFFVCKYCQLYVCKQWLVKLTFKLPASRQEHEAGNCFWDSQSEKALGKQEESVTVVLSGVSHPHNDLPTCLSASVIHLLIPSSKRSVWVEKKRKKKCTAWLVELTTESWCHRTSSTRPQCVYMGGKHIGMNYAWIGSSFLTRLLFRPGETNVRTAPQNQSNQFHYDWVKIRQAMVDFVPSNKK